MSGTAALSDGVRRRLRTYSIMLSTVVIVAIGIGVLSSGLFTGLGSPAIATDDDYYQPWENPDPVAAVEGDDEWTGVGQAYIDLDGLDPLVPFRVDFDQDGPIRGVYLTGPDASVPEGLERPTDFSTYGSDVYVVPAQARMQLWVSARDRSPWTLRIRPTGLEQRDGDVVSGLGSAKFVYVGDASAARVTTRGEYGVRIDVVTAHGPDSIYSSYSDSPEASIAWPDSAATVFVVDTYDDSSSWSLAFLTADPTQAATDTGTEASDD